MSLASRVSSSDLTHLIDAARGDAAHEVVLRRGRIVNVYTGDVTEADIGIAAGRIVGIGELPNGAIGRTTHIIDVNGRYLLPGLIDSHFHMGGSQLSMQEWALALLRVGTTTVATDLAEIYSYSGLGGVRRTLDEARATGLRVWYLPPVHLFGIERLGSFRHRPDANEMIRMLDWPETVGVNEPPPEQILGKNRDVLKVVAAALSRGLVFAGHLPAAVPRDMQAYAAVGGSSCHESTTAQEAGVKLRSGIWPMLRFGSAGPDLPRLLPLVSGSPETARWTMFCTDDQAPDDLAAEGNVNRNIRMGVAAGIEPALAVAMGSTNVALYYGMGHRYGSLAPGKAGDVAAVENLEGFEVTDVVAGGRIVVRDGVLALRRKRLARSASLTSRIRWPRPLTSQDLRIPASGSVARVRVIDVEDGSLVSRASEADLPVQAGSVEAAEDRDILKIAVVDRHSGKIRSGIAFVRGVGLKDGAVASTYCHAHQNVLLVGARDDDIVAAANEIRRIGGGVVVVARGRTVATWSLPIIGVFSSGSIGQATSGLRRVNDALRDIGCAFSSPVLSLAFIALTTIPEYGLTNRGLYDVTAQRFVATVIPAGDQV
jgi:adenine deaminase